MFALIRSALWQNCELRSLLEVYGAASSGGRFTWSDTTFIPR